MLRVPRSAGHLLALCAITGCTPSAPVANSLPPAPAGAIYPVDGGSFYTTADWEVHGTAATGPPTDVAMGDFDGDGYADLAALAEGVVRVYRGTTSGLDEEANASRHQFSAARVAGGDVNGDGYADLVVGVPADASMVLYAGSQAGLSAEGATIVSAVADTADYFGSTLASAGDVNGDGYSDVIVGACGYGSQAGYAAVHLGSPDGLVDPPAFEATGTGTDWFGWQVGGAGDVNGDGFDDVAIADSSFSTSLYYGSSSGLSTVANVVLAPEEDAQDVAGVGDLDDDGYDDFAIAYATNTYVYRGGATGLDPTNYTLLTDGSGSVADVGDVNMDGLDDLVVGASGSSDPALLLYLGDPRFVSSPPTDSATTSTNWDYGDDVAAGDIDDDGARDVVTIDSGWEDVGAVFVYRGSTTAALVLGQTLLSTSAEALGSSFANLGDVNGDGYDDAAVGAMRYEEFAGRVDVYPGSSSGLSELPATLLVGSASYAHFGEGLDGAGDFNGDGFGDVVVGAWGAGPGGAVYVYNGSSTGVSSTSTASYGSTGTSLGRIVAGLGDVNGDGLADIGALGTDEPARIFYGSSSGIGPSPDQEVGGNPYGDARRLEAIGDVNGDGVDDVALEGDHGGVIQLFYGAATGLASAGELVVTGHTFEDDLAGAGDVDGDGYDDLAVGDADYDGGDGRIYTIAGGASGLVERGAVTGTPGERLGLGMGSAGDVDEDGRADLFAKGTTVRLEVFLGSADGLAPDPTYTELDQLLGRAFDAGDFNGDGRLDVLSGDPDADHGAGAAYVYSGGDDDDGDGYLSFDDCDDSDASNVPTTLYADLDGDGFGDPSTAANVCPETPGYVDDATDCDDEDAGVHPGAIEVCDDGNTDEDCDGLVDNDDPGATGQTTFYQDADDDNHGVPTTTKVSCDAGVGWAAVDDDCDDGNGRIHPGRAEICDADDVDENCDGVADDYDSATVGQPTYYEDPDGDGYGSGEGVVSCEPVSGRVPAGGDCNEGDTAVNPGVPELCETSVDEDCDGQVDEEDDGAPVSWYRDADEDGYGRDATAKVSCSQPVGYVLLPGDCDDSDAAANPGAAELDADGIDEDCDRLEACYVDADQDHARSDTLVSSEDVDCSGDTAALTGAAVDCDDADPGVRPGAFESTGDGVDEDCDGVESCWQDADEDGSRSPYATVASDDEDCTDAGEAMTAEATDCDDSDPSAHPGAAQVCDAADHDCDGQVDEDCDPPPEAQPTCGCGSTSGSPLGGALIGLAGLVLRRRSPRRGVCGSRTDRTKLRD